MKKPILLITICFLYLFSYSQIDTNKNSQESFEEYKKRQSESFLSFKEKRDKEIQQFILNEENWNLITIGTKGNVKNNIDNISKPEAEIPETEQPKIVDKKPNYVNNEIIVPKKNEISYFHPLKDSKFKLSSPFGYRIHPVYKTRRFHSGVDLGAVKNTPIYAINDGIVLRAGVARGYGNYIVIDHKNGLKSAYAHMSTMLIRKGDKVTKGDKIGLVGMTGTATGDHLHFEVIKNDKKINPSRFIEK